ncbi:MAG: thrombospondin type 3 repeat-containing protein [Verrucomicrobiota bacterium]
MRHRSTSAGLLGLLSISGVLSVPAGAVPSFSGAEGWGAVTAGGRGGAVLHVTNLNDSGPGSYRAACEASGPRTVVFDVSGIIRLTSYVRITNPYITIAGHTAPGDGVIVAGDTTDLDGAVSEVIVRYMRFRRGYDKAKWAAWVANSSNPDPRGQCLVGLSATRNIMVDHVSVSWGTDENMSIYRRYINPPVLTGGPTVLPTKNVTIQWCISSEALNPANHAYADTLGGQGANHHHNLLASNVGRNPSISFSHFMDWRNNVIFNWRDRTMDGAGAEAHMNVVNNYYKPGPASGFDYQWNPLPALKVRIVKPEIRQNGALFGLNSKNRYCYPQAVGSWYVEGNIMEGYPAISNDNWNGQVTISGKSYRGVQWDGSISDGIILGYPGQGPGSLGAHPQWTGHFMTDHLDWAKVNAPITHVDLVQDPNDPADDINGVVIPIPDLPKVATQTAQDSYTTVLAGAGATLPVRDPVDVRTVTSVSTGVATAGARGNGIIDHPDEVGGYPVIAAVTRPANWDTDGDGMPDAWETQHGLNPTAAADRNGDFDNDGYTNLEEYLGELGAFKAVQDVVWDGSTNTRYAQIENWDIAFQPSRFDTAVINNASVVVDAIGQHAGTLRLTGNARLDITAGWLDVANNLEIAAGSTVTVLNPGTLKIAANIVNDGTLRLTGSSALNVGGTLTNNGVLDLMTCNGPRPTIVNNGIVLDSSQVKIGSARVDGTDFIVTVQGYSGHNYQLQHRASLEIGVWQDIAAPVAGADAPINFTHPSGITAGRGFYRIAVSP